MSTRKPKEKLDDRTMLHHRHSSSRLLCSILTIVLNLTHSSVFLPVTTALEQAIKTDRHQEGATFHDDIKHTKHRSLRVGAFREPWLETFQNRSTEEEAEEEEAGSMTTFVSNSAIFNVTLNTFSPDFVKPYTSLADLEQDLTAIMLFFVDGIISDVEKPPTQAPVAEEQAPGANGQTDFATNNQEEGVDEADRVKSNGRYVYAAYGDSIQVWEALTGAPVTNVTMPPVEREGLSFRFSTRGLLLSGSRLTAIFEAAWEPRVIVIVYSIELLASTGELIKLHERELNGRYRDARLIGGIVHVVSFNTFHVERTIMRPLLRWNPRFVDLDDDAYVHEAKLMAVRELVPNFVSRVISVISRDNVTLPKLARVGLWQETVSNNSIIECTVHRNLAGVNTYTQVASFNMSDDGEELGISLSGVLMPSSVGYTYSTSDMLIFTADGWNWIESMNGVGQATYLMGFSINGTSTKPSAVGTVPGVLLNQYSMDIFNGHLRVATSSQSKFSYSRDGPIWEPIAQNQVIILKIPGLIDDGEAGLFEETGHLPDLGKEFELFTGVRFFDKVAYAATFRRAGPSFYALNLTNPTNPMELGELSTSGFSSYLHSVNRDNTMLVAVGRNTNEFGGFRGVQVTLFDATDPTNPREVQRYLIENIPNGLLSSAVELDSRAFRWLGLGDAVGLVILPIYLTTFFDSSQNYDGFLVLDVSPTGISLRFNITHAQGEDFFGCYNSGRLTPRSLVFNGNVTTLKGHSALSTDPDTGELTWELEMPKPTNPEDCRLY